MSSVLGVFMFLLHWTFKIEVFGYTSLEHKGVDWNLKINFNVFSPCSGQDHLKSMWGIKQERKIKLKPT